MVVLESGVTGISAQKPVEVELKSEGEFVLILFRFMEEIFAPELQMKFKTVMKTHVKVGGFF